jgi:hypothetical protein
MAITGNSRTAAAFTLLLAVSGTFAATISNADYLAAKDHINASYLTDRAGCDAQVGTAKDVCQARAHGKQQIALAELEYSRTGKTRDLRRIAATRADANYRVAKDQCGDQTGTARVLCVAEADEVRARALLAARKITSPGDTRTDAAEDSNDADYRVALSKCDGLSGDAQSACVTAAKARYDHS